MLEANSHNQLKDLLQGDPSIWPQNLTFSRLVSRSLRRKDKSLIQLPLGSQKLYWPGLLIPLSLKSSHIVLVISDENRLNLLTYELPRLKKAGFFFSFWEGKEPPSKEKIWLLNHHQFIDAFRNRYLTSKQLVFTEAEFLSQNLTDLMSIQIGQKEWELLRRAYPKFDNQLLEIYQRMTRRLFIHSTTEDAQISIDSNEIISIKDILGFIDVLPAQWLETLSAIRKGWASWAQLNHKTLDWTWNLQPLEPFKDIKKLLNNNPFLLITGSTRNELLLSEIKSISCSLDVSISLEGMIHQEPIQLFVPFRQPLPNTEYFGEYLLHQCRRLILGVQGLTILLLNDYQLRQQLTSKLASEFGRRVVQETTFVDSHGILCCSSSWWFKYHRKLPIPYQLIVGILPLMSLESPLLAARVNQFKIEGRDWFREFLLPDLLSLLPYLVQPIRSHQGRVAILDGRLRSRSWGELVFRRLEPWIPLERLLPH